VPTSVLKAHAHMGGTKHEISLPVKGRRNSTSCGTLPELRVLSPDSAAWNNRDHWDRTQHLGAVSDMPPPGPQSPSQDKPVTRSSTRLTTRWEEKGSQIQSLTIWVCV
jgi:hypothetical protein